MHYSTDVEDFMSAIEYHGHAITNGYNIKKQRTNIPLSFFVDLKPNENNKDIYQIETLNYTKVRFEPTRSKRNIPQCGNVRDMGIPKPIGITAPGVSNAQEIISLNTAHEKRNQNMSSTSSAKATIRPTINGAPFTKKYKNELPHN
jgi:hypothetical protein